MIRKKIVYIVSDIEKSLAFEWTARELSKNHDLFFLLIGKNNTPFSKFLTESQIEYTVVDDKVIPSFFRKWIKVIMRSWFTHNLERNYNSTFTQRSPSERAPKQSQ